MANLYLVLLLVSLGLAAAGLFWPKVAVWTKRKTRLQAFGGYGALAAVFFVAFGVSLPPKSEREAVEAPPAPLPAAGQAAAKAPETYQTAGVYPLCTTEAALDEASSAIAQKDFQWLEAIKGCVLGEPGLKAVYVDRGILTSKVRVFTPKGGSAVVWTASENIVKAK